MKPRFIGIAADQGLSGLGMLMQFAGGLVAIVTLTVTCVALAMHAQFGNVNSLWVYAMLVLSLRRSFLQHRAGIVLVYGPGGYRSPQMRGVRRYVVFAFGQSAAVLAILQLNFAINGIAALAVGLALVVWPATLAVLLALPRFRQYRNEIPASEDQGFEGAAIYMTLFGLLGVTGTALGVFVTLLKVSNGRWPDYSWLFAIPPLAVLLVHSLFQLRGGWFGLRRLGIDHTVSRYADFVWQMFFVLGLFLSLMTFLDFAGWAICFGIGAALLMWPLTIRRFISKRQYGYFLAQYRPAGARTPDAGLTWLGWLLIGLAAISASFLLLQFALHETPSLRSMIPIPLTSSIWHLVTVALALWTGLELIWMNSYAKQVASLFSVVATANAICTWWLHGDSQASGTIHLLRFSPLAFALVLPVATWLLVYSRTSKNATQLPVS